MENNTPPKTREENKITHKQICEIIEAFSSVNIMYKGLIMRKVERDSAECLINTIGFEKTIDIVKNELPKLTGNKFAPTIFSPSDLVKKWNIFELYKKRTEEEPNPENTNTNQELTHDLFSIGDTFVLNGKKYCSIKFDKIVPSEKFSKIIEEFKRLHMGYISLEKMWVCPLDMFYNLFPVVNFNKETDSDNFE